MASDAWKTVERMVAAIFGGVRSWETDHDVLVVTDAMTDLPERMILHPQTLLDLSRAEFLELASIEVKNLKAPTVAQLEAFLAKNREKADRDGVRHSALVVKRKAGPGRRTPYLFVMELEIPDGNA